MNGVQITKPLLRDVSLVAIVRDEMMNPAGGIVDFVDSTVLYVEEAVIVDTGSKDGTWETLQELGKRHDNLRIFQDSDAFRKEGYAGARNLSLQHASKRMALVLDADERLTAADFGELQRIVEVNRADVYLFGLLEIDPNGCEELRTNWGHPTRMFCVKSFKYKDRVWECLHYDKNIVDSPDPKQLLALVTIKHFVPSIIVTQRKRRE